MDSEKNAAFTAAAPYSSASGGDPASAPPSSVSDDAIKPSWATISRVRRSRRSIWGPTPIETRIIGTSCTKPMRPTAAGESVMRNT
jgi:hypothetical protein